MTAREVIPILGMAALTGIVITQARAVERITHVAGQLEDRLVDAQRIQHLLGTTGSFLPDATVEGVAIDSIPSRAMVVWYMDPHTCIGCLRDLDQWTRLISNETYEALLVFVGIDEVEARQIQETYRLKGSVAADPSGAARLRFMGDHSSSLKLVLQPGGLVSAIDARTPASCRVALEDILLGPGENSEGRAVSAGGDSTWGGVGF